MTFKQSMQKQSKLSFKKDFSSSSSLSKNIHETNLNLDINSIIEQLKIKGFIDLKILKIVIAKADKILRKQPNIIKFQSPVMVIGDIHGQFYDLLNIFEKFGGARQTKYLFLGDYVDRGQFCIQVIILLLVMKITNSENVHLLRGNHESRLLTATFNFREECIRKYDQQTYAQIIDLFDSLPLAAIVDQKYFCVHAGISPQFKTTYEIQKINRFKEPPQKGGVCDLLWSDPTDDIIDSWKFNNNRMCSYFYGFKQTKNFLDRNQLKLIIRGHQVQNQGYKYQRSLTNKALTLTIFSAPNYCDTYRNKGATLFISGQQMNIFSFNQVQHPIVLPNYMNIIQWVMPFLAQEVTKIFKYFLKIQKKKMKKIQKLISSDKLFQKQMEVLQRVELIQKVISQQKLKKQEQILKQTLTAFAQYSKSQFLKIKQNDYFQKIPLNVIKTTVIGPKLSGKEKIGSIKSMVIQDEGQSQQFEEEVDSNISYNNFND